MTLKEITYSQLKQAIRIAFDGDPKIFELYDSNVSVSSIDEIVEDVYRKINEYQAHGTLILKGVYDDDKLVGYAVMLNDMLLSFSLAIGHRSKENTKMFFELIKKQFNNNFICYLWSINQRAIRFLEKYGMKKIFSDNQITKLQCQ